MSAKTKISIFFNRLLWVLAFVLPIMLAASWLLAKKLRSTLLDELNNRLQVKVEIYSLDISLWTSFPNISLRATGLQVKESLPFYHLNAIEANELTAVFNIWDVLAKGAVVEKIILDGAKVRLYKGKYGVNYDFFKPTNQDSTNLELELKKIQLTHSQVWYIDEVDLNSVNFESDKLVASGKLGDDKFKLSLVGDALFDHLKLNSKTLFLGKKFYTNSEIEVDNNINSYHIEKCLLTLGELDLDVKGDVLITKKIPDLDLTFKGKNLDLNSLVSLLPNKSFGGLKHKETSGNLYLSGYVKGRLEDDNLPNMSLVFGGDKIAYEGSAAPLPLKNLTFSGKFEKSKSKPNGVLNANISQLQIGEGQIKASFKLKLEKEMILEASSNGHLNIKELERVIPQNKVAQLQGLLNYNLKTKIGIQRNAPNWSTRLIDLDGDIELKDGSASLAADTTQIKGVQAQLTFRKGHLQINSLYAKWNENDALLKGEWRDFIRYALDSTPNLNFKGSLVSQQLDLNHAIPDFGPNETETRHSSSPQLDLDVDLVVSNLLWKKHEAKNVRGKLTMMGEDISLTDVYMNTMGGKLNADIAFEKLPDNHTRLRLKMLTQHVNISTLMARFNDFEQEEITHKNLDGYLNSEILYEQKFDENGKVDLKSVAGLGIIDISKGRLKNYKPLESLSKFVEMKELMDIKFSDLKNTIEITNGIIHIPHMKIKNNALDLEISGTHSFENEMDYHIKVFVSDILAAKYDFIKRRKEKKVEAEKGGLSAYIHMYGTPETLKIEYDKKSVSNKIATEIKTERKAFFETIKNDFKGIKKEPETPLETPKDIWDE